MRPPPDTIDPPLAPGAPARPDDADPGVPTPMMAQYIEIKAANPDCLLFYRMGDFYELFFADAAEASRALGIALTRRGKHLGQDIPMAGVPVAAADEYLSRLIALGFRVAVCEQTEDPAEARKRGSKAVVRRDVVRLVTPGTVTEDALLDPGQPNWLASLSRTGGSGPGAEWALAWADLSTGALRLGTTQPDRLLADLAALEPAEILLPDSAREDPAVRSVCERFGRAARFEPAALFDGATAADRLCRAFDVATLDGFGTFGRAELSAAAALLSYLGATQRAARLALRPPERVETGDVMLIDPATRASLELHRTVSGKRAGSLLAAIDRTVTSAGARLLAARLAWPLTDPAAIRTRADAVAFFAENRPLRASLREALRGLPDTERALSRLSLERGGPRDLGTVRAGLAQARTALDLLAGAERPDEVAESCRCLAAPPAALAGELERQLDEMLPVTRRDGGFVAAGAVPALDAARALRDRSRAVIAELQARYCTDTGVRSLKIRHNNVLGYFVEVSEGNSAPLRAMRGTDGAPLFNHRQTLASAVRFSTAELMDLEARIADAAALALRLELEVFDRLAAMVLAELPALRASAEALACLDVAAALADLAASAGWCRPLVDDSLAFRVVGGRHPVVEAALKSSGAPFVANDCDLSPPKRTDAARGEAGAIWLLTGPNMGGKSTFLRQNAIIAVLAQIGAFVPAQSAQIGVVDRLFSRVGASDDLAEGRSTFMVEMVETAAILNRAGPRTLVVLDEIGRGTATYDGLSIAFAAVEHLHEVNRSRALFATHFHEMTALSKRLKRLRNATVSVKEWEGEVIFLHEVRPGVADRSYGIQVARLAGLPPAVVERAKAVLAQLERVGQGERTAFIDDLPLFSAAAARAAAPRPAPEASPALDALRALDPDAMSPREAMDALYRLKGLLAPGNRS